MVLALQAYKMYFIKIGIVVFDIIIPIMHMIEHLTCCPESKIFPEFLNSKAKLSNPQG